ncbi:enhancer of mRNA-decapping protein 4-like [Dendronephthya gigantea]|uniref:enhancer of mRNA-decapping protein 4-like n=1 Tax=Dendronephthya gigantea TaxID=151771 RepID=UPI00106B5E7C|nr:enhancer of mRNA-decapping protein 4-like [Dendronephthya gigantea]
MDSANEDAARVLKGILNIGGMLGSDNGQASSTHDIESDSNRKNGHKFVEENITESIDSYSDRESDTFPLDPVRQFVNFSGDEQQGSVAIYGNEVHVTADEVDANVTGSSRIRINPVVNFDWESKYYNGNLLGVSSKYMAYVIRAKSGYVLRILNRKTVVKALIKGFTGSIEDVSFSHDNSDQLACIDAAGDVFVWTISEDDNQIDYDLKLHVKRENNKLPEPSSGNRIVWCPYIVDEEENVSEKVLSVIVGQVAEVLHVDMITKKYGNVVDVEDIKSGILRIQNGHTKFITDISLAPDGSVLATASDDGGVKFWQLNFESADAPLCLHEWQPHEGQSVSRLMFCDNHLAEDNKSPFWRFLITGAKRNSELKIWCTVTWSCLQTIKFKPPASSLPSVNPPPLKLKASLDLSSQFLVLSDIDRKVLFVFLLHQNLDEGKAHVTSVAHFILTQPLLSFVISEAKTFKASMRDSMDQNGDREDHEQDEEGQEDSEEKPIPTIRIKLHCINPKAMQEMIVQYYPYTSIRPVTPTSLAASSITNTETGIQDGLSDVSGLDTSLTELEDTGTRSDNSTPRLIAPDAFVTMVPKPVKPISKGAKDIAVTQAAPASVTSSITSVTSMSNSLLSEDVNQPRGEKSQIAESECSFKTCDDVTLQDHSSGANSWLLGETSPLGPPLPVSPDPAKVPFPAFNTEIRGVNEAPKDDISAIAHSTPMRPLRTLDGDEDNDKTPTGDDEITVKKDDILSSSPRDSPLLPQGHSPPGEKGEDEKLMFAEGHGQAGFDSIGSERFFTKMKDFTKVSSLQTPVTGQRNETDEGLSRSRKRNTNLTVTPRKQIDIPPDAREQAPPTNSAALDDIRDDIRQLRELLQAQQREQNVKISDVLREEVASLEGAVSSSLGSILAEHNAEQDQMFEKFTRDKNVNEKQRYEKMTTSITTAVLNKVEKIVKNEIRNSVGSGFQKIAPSLQDELNTVMTQKLRVADEVMRESIARMVKEKSVLDAIGKAVGEAIQVSFSATMNDFLNKSMLPGFEKACRAMYAQINTAFENGTKQYIQNFESYAESRKEIEKQQKDTIVDQLQILVQNFQVASEKLSTSMSGSLLEMMQTQLTTSMKKLQSSLLEQLQEDLNKSLQETIQKEVTNVLIEQSAFSGESKDQTKHRNTQLRIKQLIDERNFSGAFLEALTAGDLELVTLVCQACDPSELFGQDPCPFNQPTLLSLIQQLSVELSSNTELKYRYIEEAILALDTEDPVTKEHVDAILRGLCEQIKATNHLLAQDDSTKPLQRSLKRLYMAAMSLIK